MTKQEEVYCKKDESCFPLLKNIIEKFYYGIKVRFNDLGTAPTSSQTQACVKVPHAKNYQLNKIFDKSKNEIELAALEQTGEDADRFATHCFPVGQIERFGEKSFYIILRKSEKRASDKQLEGAKGLPDFQLYFLEKPRCASMSLESRLA